MGVSRLTNQYAVIGSVMISPECLSAARQIVSADDFSDPVCKAAFETACQIEDEGGVVDPMVIADKVSAATGKDDAVNLLGEMMKITPTANNVEEYCKLVKKDARAERIRRITEEASAALDTGSDPSEVIANIQQQMQAEAETQEGVKDSRKAVSDFSDYFTLVHNDPDAAYCSTGYKSVDNVLGGGMFRSGLYIVGARPGMGKTTLAINIAENIVKSGKRILFCSLEMSDHQITAKRIALTSGCNYTGLMNGKLSDGMIRKAFDAVSVLHEETFDLCDRSDLKVSDIYVMAKQIRDLECIMVDYLGLLSPENPEQYVSRYEAVTEISKNLKALAKRLNIPVIALAQLNRENTKTKDKAPQLQDLRDAGSIEQDADCVIMLHRPNYYNGENKTIEDIMLIIEKNRHGMTDTVTMQWNGSTGQIIDMPQTARVIQSSNDEMPF